CGAVIKNNVLRGNNNMNAGKSLWHAAQIYTRSSKDVQIFGNDVTAAGTGVHGIGIRGDDVNGVQTVYSAANCGSIEARNITVHDNVVRLDTGNEHGRVGPGTGTTYNINFTNNIYYLQNLSAGYFQYNGAISLQTKEQW